MTIAEMLQQSLILTVLGMCVVFSFLVIMIGCMNLLRLGVHAAGLDKEPEPAAASQAPAAAPQDKNAIVAAIAAALREKN